MVVAEPVVPLPMAAAALAGLLLTVGVAPVALPLMAAAAPDEIDSTR